VGSNPTFSTITERTKMLKPNASFKLDKQTKRLMATILDKHQRGQYKKTMIEAQLQSLITPRITKNKRDNTADQDE
jgi:hypothetical protein